MMTVILTGGQSRRMGRDKALLDFKGLPMNLALARKYESLGPVAFSVDREGRFPKGEYQELVDIFPGQGPLNGLISAFAKSEEDIVLLTATDMPGGTVEAAQKLLAALGEHDACIYQGEPLFGIYRRSCLPAALRCLEEGKRSFRDLFAQIDVLRLERPGEELFQNLNTPEEYEAYQGK